MRLDPGAARALFRYPWPLNVRELELSLGTALALCGDGAIEAAHLPEAVRLGRAASARPEEECGVREELVALLREHGGNVAEVARVFGKGRMQIHRWARRYGIALASFRR